MRSFNNISIRRKLVIIQVTTAFVAVFICCLIFLFNDFKIYKQHSIKNTLSIAKLVGVSAEAPILFLDKESADKILTNLSSNESILNAVISDVKGKEFARYAKKGSEHFSFHLADPKEIEDPGFINQKFIVNYKIYKDNEFIGTVRLRAELSDFGEIIRGYLLASAIILAISVLAAFLISIFLQRLITNRLTSLVQRTKEMTETGDFSSQIDVEGKDEIATLTNEFNEMLRQIERGQKALMETNADLEVHVSERTKELERFVYVASHDLQEPLRTITNFVGLINEKYSGKLDEDTDVHLKFIVDATEKMQNLIKDLLDISRIGRSEVFSMVNCEEVLKEVKEMMGASISESNAIITSSNLPVLMGNESELKQLFQNLISNAIKFRKINVQPTIEISAEEQEKEYLFTVKDNGIGISEQYFEKLFIIFQRLHNETEYAGTGIGLATCKKIVALHNGRIWVESKSGVGSTFYFTISKELK